MGFKKQFAALLFVLLFSNILYCKQKQVAFCVDLSKSTNGIVPQLQSAIWSIPQLKSLQQTKVAFVGYGRIAYQSMPYKSKVLGDFSDGFFEVSYQILKTQEYVLGTDAIHHLALENALENLEWEATSDKTIYMIANGVINNSKIKKLKKKLDEAGIRLVLIYYQVENSKSFFKKWEKLAKGINCTILELQAIQKQKIKFDKNYDANYLQDAGKDLLNTYIPYGKTSERNYKKLEFVMEKSKDLGNDVLEQSLGFLAGKHYQGKMRHWDLLDLYALDPAALKKLDKKYLPDFMQSFTTQQLQSYCHLKLRKRKLIVEKIKVDAERREAFLKKQLIKTKNFTGNYNLQIVLLNNLLS